MQILAPVAAPACNRAGGGHRRPAALDRAGGRCRSAADRGTLHGRVRRRGGGRIILTAIQPTVYPALQRFGVIDLLGPENVFQHTRCAIDSIDEPERPGGAPARPRGVRVTLRFAPVAPPRYALPMSRPLEDVTILDLTWVLAGPYASMVLCDLGADVIKVERPPYGDIARTTGPYQNNWSGYFFSINRGKRAISIDLRSDEGRELFLKLVEKVDVVMENFTPGTMDRLGIGYATLSARNPRLIFASTSGFGQTGPYRDRPALDIVVQAMGGVMSITGEAGGNPVRPGVSYGDITAGLFTAVGILSALHERERSGLGQAIDISMLDCQVSVLEGAITRYYVSGKAPEPIGTRHPSATPFQAFPTADGWVVIALGFGVENQWGLFCGLLGLPDLIDDERFETSPKRTRNHAVLEPLLNEALRKRTTQEWLDDLIAVGIPCGPLNTVPQMLADPQIQHRGIVKEVTHHIAGTIPLADSPVRMSRSETGIKGPPPDLGQDTAAVLGELLGLGADDVAALEAAGTVATHGGPDIAAIA